VGTHWRAGSEGGGAATATAAVAVAAAAAVADERGGTGGRVGRDK